MLEKKYEICWLMLNSHHDSWHIIDTSCLLTMERPEKKLIFVKVMGQDSEIDEVKKSCFRKECEDNGLKVESLRWRRYFCGDCEEPENLDLLKES